MRLVGTRAAGLLALAAAVGCDNRPPTTELKGKVTYKGEQLGGMSLRFVAPDGREATAQVGFEGAYEAVAVPLGTVAVGVVPPAGPAGPPVKLDPKLAASLPKRPTTSAKLPDRFRDPKTSGLTFEIAKGMKNLDITIP
jgi:hypothetical protein